MKWVAPVYLLVVLIGFSYSQLPGKLRDIANNPIELWTVVIIVATLLLLVAVLAVGERRWRAAGLDLDGETS
jgi:uncharacterized membrane protein YhaH (DUF805 family)